MNWFIATETKLINLDKAATINLSKDDNSIRLWFPEAEDGEDVIILYYESEEMASKVFSSLMFKVAKKYEL